MLTRRSTYLTKALISLLVLIGAFACSKNRKTHDGDAERPASSMSDLYGLKKVPTFSIQLGDADMRSLRDSPKEWRKADFEYAGQRFESVDLRIKGHRSLRSIDDKPGLKLRFDKGKDHKERRFLDLKRLTLNNLVEDPTMIREYLAYRLAREVGLPVPKAGYAQLTLNDQNYGLYLVVETPDEDFLTRRFGSGEGELYEGEYGCDLTPADVSGFDQDVGGDDRSGLHAFAETVSRGGEGIWSGAEAPMTIEHLSMFLAFSNYVGDFDGYQHSHNYRIYSNPQDRKWQLMSWGLDRSFFKSIPPYSSRGLLAKRCFAQASCRHAYLMALREVQKAAEKVDLITGAKVISAVIGDSVNADTRRPYQAKKITEQRAKLVEFLQGRAAYVREATLCLTETGEEIDNDGDGFGCMDCNDADASVHPGASETCDAVDNDCTGLIDDSPACPCADVAIGNKNLALCQLPMPWAEAEEFCVGKGGHLASLESLEELNQLRAIADTYDKDRWWIGANDRAKEGEFLWSAGGEIAPSLWHKGQPDNSTCNQDCAVLHDKNMLHDTHCGQHYSFACQLPGPQLPAPGPPAPGP